MKKEFEEFYSDLQQGTLDQLKVSWEKARREKRIKTIVVILSIIIVDILIVKFFMKSITNIFVINMLLIIDVMIFIVGEIILSRHASEYNKKYKETVIDNMLKNFYTEVDYIPKKKMPREIYNEARYPEYYNRYYSDDYFEGLVDNKYRIKMAEVKTVQEEKSKDDKTTTTTKFHGVFAKIEMDKSINNELIIRPNGGFIFDKKLEMDSQEFEKYFDVKSQNQIIGMQILTHEIMEILVSMQKIAKNGFSISIYDNKLYLRMWTGSVFESTAIKNGVIDKKTLENYYNIIDTINTLSKTMIKAIEETQI